MHRSSLLALLVGLLISGSAHAADAPRPGATSPDVAVRIRLYGSEVVSAADGTVAMRVATDALSTAGIDVSWRACARTPPSDHPCGAPLDASEVVVRLIASAPDAATNTSARPLGNAFVPAVHPRTGQLATIYIDRVVWLANRARTARGELLGRAIAHEIGHLLLGSTTHTPTGLMRGAWSDVELRQERPEDWVFPPPLAGLLQSRVAERTGRSALETSPFGCGTD